MGRACCDNEPVQFEDVLSELDYDPRTVEVLQSVAQYGSFIAVRQEHARAFAEWRAVDVNSLVEEALTLAYHGARAQDQGRGIAPIELVAQDMTRVFLNLFGNGFYGTDKRRREDRAGSFRPVLKVATRDLGNGVEITVRDNGTGISPEIGEKLFQPFFTTKPTGEGTGLGLSITWDIVTQQHSGSISVDSQVGEFTEFRIRLPRGRHALTTGRAA